MSKIAFKKFKQHPHESRILMLKFKCDVGTVKCNLEQLRSNCGIAFLSNPHWNPGATCRYDDRGNFSEEYEANKVKLYEEFHKFIMLHSDRNKIMVSDKVGGSRWFDFCRHNNWREGEHTFNGNSHNEVVIFETNRDLLLGKDLEMLM